MAGTTGDRTSVGETEVRGVRVDGETRCTHYASERDVVAVEFACCGTVYPCFQCHEELADHEGETWPRVARNEPAVLCGVCGGRLTIGAYLDVLEGDVACPNCSAAFNPGCREHCGRYFER